MSARDLIETLVQRGHSVATAESLTGGLLCAELTRVPGASAVVRGGLVAYAVAVKSDVLGVDATVLERRGAVDGEVATQMARGVRRLLGATYGVATTGAAGPDPDPGGADTGPVAPGVGFVAVSGPDGDIVRPFDGHGGDREAVRRTAVDTALEVLRQALGGHAAP